MELPIITISSANPNPYMRGIEAIEEIFEDLPEGLDTEKKQEYIENLLMARDMLHRWRQEELKRA